MSETIDELLKHPLTRYYLHQIKRGSTLEKKKRNDEINALYKNGVTISEIGRKYGISRQRVFQIIHNRR